MIGMTVFIGWAGETSKEIASILKNWLNEMFDGFIDVFTPVSPPIDIIPRSDALDNAISAECALLCVTADNVNSQWLYYEAGVLSRNVKLMAPILCGVSSSQLAAPLRMFQPISFEVDDIWKLTVELNHLCYEEFMQLQLDTHRPLARQTWLHSEELERRFQARYPTLEALLMEKLSERKSQFSSEPDEWERAERKLDTLLSLISEETKELKNKIAELEEQTAELEKQIANNEKIIDKLENRHFFANFFRKNSRHDRETDS